MPISKSAKKSLASSISKGQRNQKQEVELEKILKKASASNVNEVISKIDKAAKTHLISQNKAARLKSRLAKKFGTPKKTKIKGDKAEKASKAKKATKAKKAEVSKKK